MPTAPQPRSPASAPSVSSSAGPSPTARSTPTRPPACPQPKVPDHPTRVLTDDELRAIYRTCEGHDFIARRDLALIRLFTSTGLRLNELANIRYDPNHPNQNDVSLDPGSLRVTRKGGAQQEVGIGGAKAVEALAWYLRARARQRHADQPALWLGQDGSPLGAHGIALMIARRGREAGVTWRLHPHAFRTTFAVEYLTQGGNEVDLQRHGRLAVKPNDRPLHPPPRRRTGSRRDTPDADRGPHLANGTCADQPT